MQSYTVITCVLKMRSNNFSYRDIRARYGLGQGTVKLILDRLISKASRLEFNGRNMRNPNM